MKYFLSVILSLLLAHFGNAQRIYSLDEISLLQHEEGNDNFSIDSLNSSNPKTRAIAFLSLIKENTNLNLGSFLVLNVYDYREIYVREWGSSFTLGEFYLKTLNNEGDYLKYEADYSEELDSIYKHIYLEDQIPLYEDYLIRNVPPIPEIYTKIKFLFENKDEKYLISLAKYGKNEDVKIINDQLYIDNENLSNALVAVQYLPSEKYVENLIEIIYFYSESKELYGGIEFTMIETCILLDQSLNLALFNTVIDSCKSKFKKRVYSDYKDRIRIEGVFY